MFIHWHVGAAGVFNSSFATSPPRSFVLDLALMRAVPSTLRTRQSSALAVSNPTHNAHMVTKRRTCCAKACIFCRIVKEAGPRLLYQDDLVVALPDIRPAAAVHLLVLPKAHIPNVSSLTGSDTALVRHMVTVGEQLLQQQEQQQALQQPAQHKFGFHKPPFRSIDHLHLHCFTLPHKWYRWVQYQSDINWITAEDLIDQLSRLPSAPVAGTSAQGPTQPGTPLTSVVTPITHVTPVTPK